VIVSESRLASAYPDAPRPASSATDGLTPRSQALLRSVRSTLKGLIVPAQADPPFF